MSEYSHVCHRCKKPIIYGTRMAEVTEWIPMHERRRDRFQDPRNGLPDPDFRHIRYHLKCLPPNMFHSIQGRALAAGPVAASLPEHGSSRASDCGEHVAMGPPLAIDDVYKVGGRACASGVQRGANPYTYGGHFFFAWDRGWFGMHELMMLDLKERARAR